MKSRSWRIGLSGTQDVPIVARVVLIVLVLAGVASLVFGAKVLVDSQRFMAKANTATAKVVAVDRVVERVRRGSGDNAYYENVPYYYPVVQFVTAREQVMRLRANEGSENHSAYRVGDSIRILYDPANPGHARVDTAASRWGAGIILIFMGLMFVVIPPVLYWLLRSSGRAGWRAT
jgi:Protein of unknown function (DUF3592)